MGDERDRANAVKHYDDDQPGMFGDELLEVGPGPGLTTDVLRRKAARVTAVELDLALAEKLAARRELHVDDVFVPVDPGTLKARLRTAGFGRARVEVAGDRIRFAATRS